MNFRSFDRFHHESCSSHVFKQQMLVHATIIVSMPLNVSAHSDMLSNLSFMKPLQPSAVMLMLWSHVGLRYM